MKAIAKITAVLICTVFLLPLAASALEQTEVDYNKTGTIKYTADGNGFYVYLGNPTVSFDTLMPDEQFVAFCVDPVQYSEKVTQVELVNPSAVEGGLEAAWLFDNKYAEDNVTIGALQLAMWEAVWDPGNYDLNDGNFKRKSHLNVYGSGTASDLLTKAEGFLEDLSLNFEAGDLDMRYAITQNADHQDFIVQMPNPNATPEPGTVILLGLGLVGMVGIGRKQFRK